MELTVDFFDNDERFILNGVAENIPVSSLTKRRCLAQLSFSREACTDDALSAVLDELISKMENISEDGWNFLRLHIPFEVLATADEEE